MERLDRGELRRHSAGEAVAEEGDDLKGPEAGQRGRDSPGEVGPVDKDLHHGPGVVAEHAGEVAAGVAGGDPRCERAAGVGRHVALELEKYLLLRRRCLRHRRRRPAEDDDNDNEGK